MSMAEQSKNQFEADESDDEKEREIHNDGPAGGNRGKVEGAGDEQHTDTHKKTKIQFLT